MQSPRQTCVILSSQILPVDATNYHILPWSFSSRCTPLQRAAPLQSRRAPVFLLRPSILGSLFSFLSSIGTAAAKVSQASTAPLSSKCVHVLQVGSSLLPARASGNRPGQHMHSGLEFLLATCGGFVHIPRRYGRSTHQPEDAPYGEVGPDLQYHPPLSDGHRAPERDLKSLASFGVDCCGTLQLRAQGITAQAKINSKIGCVLALILVIVRVLGLSLQVSKSRLPRTLQVDRLTNRCPCRVVTIQLWDWPFGNLTSSMPNRSSCSECS